MTEPTVDEMAERVREALTNLHRCTYGPDSHLDRQYEAGRIAVDAVAARVRDAEQERDEAREALAQLRGAWNHHFATCEHPARDVLVSSLPSPTMAQIEAWMNAPSNTASASLTPTPNRAEAAEARVRVLERERDEALSVSAENFTMRHRAEERAEAAAARVRDLEAALLALADLAEAFLGGRPGDETYVDLRRGVTNARAALVAVPAAEKEQCR